VGEIKEIDHLDDLSVDVRTILKWILNEIMYEDVNLMNIAHNRVR
jgi:hypothetical protein